MAIAFRSATTTSNSPGVATLTVNVPAGTTNGDLLLLCGSNSHPDSYTTPSGWTLLDSPLVTGIGRSALFWRIASSEPASYNLTRASSGQASTAVMLCYSGVTSSPIRDHKTSTADNTTTGTPAALAGVTGSDMAVHFYGSAEDAGSTTNLSMTPPGGSWNTRANVHDSKGGAAQFGSSIVAIDQIGSSATPSTTSNANCGWPICSVALIATQTVSPTGIASAESFGTPTVTVGQTVSPTGIASAETFGIPTVLTGQIVSPTGIASGGALGTPTITVGTPLPASGTLRRFDSLIRVARDTRQQLDDTASTALARLGTHTHSTAPGPFVLAQYPTGGRPPASTSGAGAAIYDTTLSKPVFSDGSVWRDAAGTAV